MNPSFITFTVLSKPSPSEQLFFLKLLFRVTPRIIMERMSLWQGNMNAMDLALPCKQKKLILKLAVELLNHSWKLFPRNFFLIAFAGCMAEILSKNISFTSISRRFSKACIPSACMWKSKNLIISFAEAFGSSFYHQCITHLPSCFQILGVHFFRKTSQWLLQLMHVTLHPKKISDFLK